MNSSKQYLPNLPNLPKLDFSMDSPTPASDTLLKSERGGIRSILVMLLGLSLGVFILIFFVFGQIIPPNAIGIRKNSFSLLGLLNEGYQSDGLMPGLHWKIPSISTIELLPRDFQLINFNSHDKSGDLTRETLEIPTSDGSKVKTDITMILRYFDKPETGDATEVKASRYYQIIEGSKVPIFVAKKRKHGGPKELVNKYGRSAKEQLRLFSVNAEQVLKERLSTLSTKNYYNPVLRESAAFDANEIINNDINPWGIEVMATLIRRYVYSDQNIDDQIFAKNLQEQTELLNAADRALEQARAETETTKASWDADIAVLTVQGEAQRDVIVSEAERYRVEQFSLGDRVVQEAIAEVKKAKNTILTDTKGADIYVAMKMTPLLQTLEGGVVADIDPFDIDAWVKKMIGKE